MAKQSKSQWDFGGELFPTQEMRRVFSVTEVTATVRRLIEERVGTVWVTGEISNLRAQSSGHIYFSLKDANAQLACVCFRDDARSTRAEQSASLCPASTAILYNKPGWSRRWAKTASFAVLHQPPWPWGLPNATTTSRSG